MTPAASHLKLAMLESMRLNGDLTKEQREVLPETPVESEVLEMEVEI